MEIKKHCSLESDSHISDLLLDEWRTEEREEGLTCKHHTAGGLNTGLKTPKERRRGRERR